MSEHYNGALILPKMVRGQIGWYIDSPTNRHIFGPNWIARDWFPKLLIPPDGGLQNGDMFTPQGIVRPYIDLSIAPLWRRWLNRLSHWIRSL